jgi:aminoglycoside 3-N-acetyltransferase
MPARRDYATRRSLAADLRALGLGEGDTVMAHAALRRLGPLLGGPDSLISAIRDVVGPEGTLLVYTDWGSADGVWRSDGSIPDAIKPDVPPFDPQASRATRDNGAFVELVRTTPGAVRSGNPGASCAALGARAEWLTADHPLDYGYGAGSPLAKLVEAEGKVAMLGAPLDRMTLLHHAEAIADIADKRIVRREEPLLQNGEVVWRWIEEFNTSHPVVAGLDEDYFAHVVEEFLASGRGRRGHIAKAEAVLVPAADIVAFAARWLEARFPKPE